MKITKRQLRRIIREALIIEVSGDPCWSGYEMIGMKKKNGRTVPNCVPVKEADVVLEEDDLAEAEYQGRKVSVNKPTAIRKGETGHGKKQKKVYVKDGPKEDDVKVVRFGDPKSTIKSHIPANKKSFRARHNCDDPGPKTKARYWSCKEW